MSHADYQPVVEDVEVDEEDVEPTASARVQAMLTSLLVLVIGKTGNGKSSLCNTILKGSQFETGSSMSSTTLKMQTADTTRDNVKIKVVDTPDVTNLAIPKSEMEEEVSKWKNETLRSPFIVLLAVRCDVRYTAEEYAVYKEFLRLWRDNSVKSRLVVAFTFGDRQNGDIGEELKTVCPELQSVLKDDGDRYVVFNNKANAELKAGMVGELFTKVKNIRNDENLGPVWSWKESIVFILLLVTGVLCACGITKDIPGLAAVFGLAYFLILAVIIWRKLELTSVIIRSR